MKNTMTAAGISAAILTGGMTAAQVASADVSANIGVTSNYVWRGATQTGNSPAIQGGIDWETDIGIYVGTWMSNVNFGDTVDGTLVDGFESRSGSEYEADFYAGWGLDFLDDNLGFDVGYVYYHYGQLENGADFGELYGSFNFWWFEVGAAYTVNDQSCDGFEPNCLNDKDSGAFVVGDFFYYGKFSIDFAESWNFSLTGGQYQFKNDDEVTPDGDINELNYGYWQADITKSADEYGDITLSVSQAGVEADGNDSAKFFIGWTKAF